MSTEPCGPGTPHATAFRVMLRLQIVPELRREFEQTWYSVGDAITGNSANRGQWLLRSSEEPDVYYIMSDWVDEPRFREFEHSPAHVEHRKKLHPFRTGGSMTTMEIVYALPASLEMAS
jgi:heme-degrading monooxygenase HmoA